MADQKRYCVIDTEVVVLANTKTTRHVSSAQRARWAILRHAVMQGVTPVYGRTLLQEYVVRLKGAMQSDLIQEFVKALHTHGKVNEKGLVRHERADLGRCRYPKHDEHLIKTAKGIPAIVITAEEQAILDSAECVNSTTRLGIRILSPSDTLHHWKLPSL